MKYTLIFILCLLVPFAQATEEWIYKTTYFDITTSISSPIDIQKTSSDPILDYVTAELFFIPQQDERQQIKKLTIIPEGTKKEKSIEFVWIKPEERQLNFQLDAEIRTEYYLPEIRKKISFPLQNLDEELSNYTQPTMLIDSNNQDIILLASSLASGRDDLYDVVFTLSEWVLENVNYSLNTVTEKVSQKASWVLKNKYGVCDEITTLFIALCRSLGIPAKYVGGLAFTNLNDINDFGPHAWAEVYFPSVGWIPYDITYGEFGFIDGTHIKLKEYQDPEENSVRYEWRGRDVDIITNKLTMDATILKSGPEISELVKINSYVAHDMVGFGSYNLLIAEIQNLNTFYISTSVAVVKSSEVVIIGTNRKYLFLKPLEKKKLYWIIKVEDTLSPQYIYTFPLSVYSIQNITGDTEFTAQADSPVYKYKEIQDFIEQQGEEEKKVYSQNVDLACSANESFYYNNEEILLSCTVKNTGNVLLQNLKICLQKDCHAYDLGINQEKQIYFSKKFEDEAEHTIKITATNSIVSKAFYVPVIVYKRPQIMLENLDYPSFVSYNDDYRISFLMNKTTKADAYNLVIALSRGELSKKWEIEKLTYTQEFVIGLRGKDLNLHENKFTLTLQYKDKDNYVYSKEEEFVITLKDVTFFQRIAILLKQIDLKLQNMLASIF